MAILLIRHGETLGNRNRVVQVPETPLSDRGLEQAARLGARLVTNPIREIWTSPQTRARMTAEAIERATGLTAHERPDLAERNFGTVRGTPYAELGFDLMGPNFDPPGGESWAVFHQRVDRIWSEVETHWLQHYVSERERTEPGGHLVIVSHGLVCRSLIERRLLPDADLAEFRDENGAVFLRNTSLTVIEPRVSAAGITEYSVPLVGCVAHLEEGIPEALGPA